MASLALLRFALGALLFVSTLRFIGNGWVERFFVEPRYYFPYYGFEWVSPLSPSGMMAVHLVMAAAAFMVALGLFYRASAWTLFLTFTYVELIDVTNYLNHYYLVSLLLLLCAFLPLSGMWSVDALIFPNARRDTLPAWCVYLFRAQIGIVYLGAALAKATPDWLLHGQPLGIWLASRAETPLLGPLLALPLAPYLFSWAGFLHDLFAPFALLSKRLRPFALPVVVGFHLATHLLFTIGIFPFLMPLCATVFFAPSWPRDLLRHVQRVLGHLVPNLTLVLPTENRRQGRRTTLRWLLPLAAVYLVVQIALPLRAHLYPGNVLWSEEGMRFSWRVMVREKNGAIMYRVRTDEWGGEKQVPPSRYLTSHQEREFSGQPDMIARLAKDIAADYRARGYHGVEVRADAWVSLNGRPSARMIDPTVDLARVNIGWRSASWIRPAPNSDPLMVLANW